MKSFFLKAMAIIFLTGSSIVVSSGKVSAQSTYSQIITLFATKCFGSDCHSPSNTDPIVKLIDSTLNGDAIVYNNIINTHPINPSADSSGYKIIVPFKADSSFLLRKIDCNRPGGTESPLREEEGDCMPQTDWATPDTNLLLSLAEVDLIRDWIACGAPDTGVISGGCTTGIFDRELNLSGLNIFPNPFTNSFNVSYNLHKTARIKLVLLNVLGEELTTLVDEEQPKGNYRFEFNASEKIALPGIYMINFSVDQEFTSKKIVRLD